jgi:hypothetical protein
MRSINDDLDRAVIELDAKSTTFGGRVRSLASLLKRTASKGVGFGASLPKMATHPQRWPII